MQESHNLTYTGHRGIEATQKSIETYFYWPSICKDIKGYVTKCIVCEKFKYDRGKDPKLLQPLPILDGPW